MLIKNVLKTICLFYNSKLKILDNCDYKNKKLTSLIKLDQLADALLQTYLIIFLFNKRNKKHSLLQQYEFRLNVI